MAASKMDKLKAKVEAAQRALDMERGKVFFTIMKPYLLKLNTMVKKVEKKLSAKAQKVLATIIEQDFGCNRNKVINLMSVVLGETLPIPQVDSYNRPADGRIIVVLKDLDDHTYELGGTYIVVYSDECYLMDAEGNVGNQGPIDRSDKEGFWRYATPAEVKAFINKMNLKALRIVNYAMVLEEATEQNFNPDKTSYSFDQELAALKELGK